MRARGLAAAARTAFRVAVSRAFDRPGGCFSPFARATRCAIGLGPVFSLGRTAPPVHAILSNSATAAVGAPVPDCHRLWWAFQALHGRTACPTTGIRDRLSAFRSPLLCGSRLISSPGLNDMLKFSPCSRAAQEQCRRAPPDDALRELQPHCTARGLGPETFEDRRVAWC